MSEDKRRGANLNLITLFFLLPREQPIYFNSAPPAPTKMPPTNLRHILLCREQRVHRLGGAGVTEKNLGQKIFEGCPM